MWMNLENIVEKETRQKDHICIKHSERNKFIETVKTDVTIRGWGMEVIA